MKLYRKLLRLIHGVPKKELTWTVKDFNEAVSLLKRTDDPQNTKNSLWRRFSNSWYDSVDILHQANLIIRLNY